MEELNEIKSNERYQVKKYSRWWYAILDSKKDLYVNKKSKKGEPIKLLLFKNKQDAEKWCHEANDSYEIKSNSRGLDDVIESLDYNESVESIFEENYKEINNN